MEKRKNTVFIPCGHFNTCFDCSEQWVKINKNCYYCREECHKLLIYVKE